MPYRSNPGGLFNSGVYPDSRPRVDVAGILDAIGNGATSLIHATMMRKQAENEMQLRSAEANRANAQVDIERQREAREAANQQQEFGLRKEEARHRFIEAGGIPAHTDVGTSTTETPITPIAPPSPIRRAMTPSASPSDPGLQEPIPAAQSPIASSAPVSSMTTTEVPESYDPARGAAYARGVAVQQLRNEGWIPKEEEKGRIQAENQAAHDQRVAAMRQAAQKGAESIAKIRAASKNSPTKSAMLMGQQERGRLATAYDIVNNAGGSYDQAAAFLNGDTPEAKAARDQGVSLTHLMQAHGQYNKEGTSQAVRMQSGALGMDPTEAVGAVATTRKLTSGGKKAAATGDAGNIDLSKTPAAPAAPAAPTKAPSLKVAPKSDTSSSGDNFTDDEVLEAYGAGKKSDKDIATYIKQQRAKKASRGGN